MKAKGSKIQKLQRKTRRVNFIDPDGRFFNKRPIDSKWSKPIGDLVYTYMRNVKQITITELAAMTTDLVMV